MLVERIAVAPVKGLRLDHPDVVEVTEAGVPYDRRYAMIDTRGRLANGKPADRRGQVLDRLVEAPGSQRRDAQGVLHGP